MFDSLPPRVLVPALVVSLCVVFTIGFYFGFKSGNTSSQAQGVLETIQANEQGEVTVTATEVPGVKWLRVGEKPECPTSHPVKDKFNPDAHLFYAPDSKMYARVAPQLCFATEDYARQAGFTKKF